MDEEGDDIDGDGSGVDDNMGALSFVVRLRWAQVLLRAGNDAAFVTAESALIRTFKQVSFFSVTFFARNF